MGQRLQEMRLQIMMNEMVKEHDCRGGGGGGGVGLRSQCWQRQGSALHCWVGVTVGSVASS